MTDRTLTDGNVVKQDLGISGQVKLIIFDGDDLGSPGDIATNVAGELVMAPPPAASSNATIDFQRFNSSGTWTKPAGLHANSPVLIRKWNGGGGGQLGASGGGGGGGGYRERWCLLSNLGATETVTIGAGGVGRVTTNAAGGNGGVSSIGTVLAGGEGGQGGAVGSGVGGDGGGPFTAPNGRIILETSLPTYQGQGGVSTGAGAAGIWHGGGGGGNANTGVGGDSIYGGAGGGGTGSTLAAVGGVSVNAGNGGNGGVNGASAQAGTQPAGGGGGAENTGGASSGAGAPGRIDVIVFGFPA